MVFNISSVYPTGKEGYFLRLRSPNSPGLGYSGEKPSMSMGAWRLSIIFRHAMQDLFNFEYFQHYK
jgi:hypothetical protein